MNEVKRAPFGALQVTNGRLTDKNGKTVQLKGISTSGLQWYPEYVNKETFAFLQETMHINVIRLAMYTAEKGYCELDDQGKAEMEKLIVKGVKAAGELGLYVLVDWHILADGNPNQYKQEAITFFEHMSKEFSNLEHVIYEICNEPNGNVNWADIQKYATEIIPVIRKNAPESVVIVGTPTSSQEVDKPKADPLPFDNLMYALHFYAATHKESLRNVMKDALDEGLPIFVTEFGICDASGDGELDLMEADKWITLMNEYDMSYCIWNLSNRDEAAALIRKDCNKIKDLSFEEWNPEGQWFLQLMER